MTARCVRDLKLAADFVKSVETGDTLVNYELRELASMIERVAKRLDLSIWLGRHFRSIPDFNHISKIIHQQWSLSAKHPKLPKQKPNKNKPLAEFFAPVRCPP